MASTHWKISGDAKKLLNEWGKAEKAYRDVGKSAKDTAGDSKKAEKKTQGALEKTQKEVKEVGRDREKVNRRWTRSAREEAQAQKKVGRSMRKTKESSLGIKRLTSGISKGMVGWAAGLASVGVAVATLASEFEALKRVSSEVGDNIERTLGFGKGRKSAGGESSSKELFRGLASLPAERAPISFDERTSLAAAMQNVNEDITTGQAVRGVGAVAKLQGILDKSTRKAVAENFASLLKQQEGLKEGGVGEGRDLVAIATRLAQENVSLAGKMDRFLLEAKGEGIDPKQALGLVLGGGKAGQTRLSTLIGEARQLTVKEAAQGGAGIVQGPQGQLQTGSGQQVFRNTTAAMQAMIANPQLAQSKEARTVIKALRDQVDDFSDLSGLIKGHAGSEGLEPGPLFEKNRRQAIAETRVSLAETGRGGEALNEQAKSQEVQAGALESGLPVGISEKLGQGVGIARAVNQFYARLPFTGIGAANQLFGGSGGGEGAAGSGDDEGARGVMEVLQGLLGESKKQTRELQEMRQKKGLRPNV